MIDKSGHDDKLDIWCLGVLAYELLTGKTPFVVSTPKNELKKIEVKKIIEQNILDVNISFPNDFPIMAKSFILGMVKRKPEERMTLKDIMNHEWLTNEPEKQLELIPMPKRGQNKEPPLLDAQDNSSIINSLNKKIKDL
jgi:serine/threonine protein kinase